MKVKVAAIQMSADIGGREANVERAERLLIQAARQGADLCVLPELALDEFFPLYKDTRYFAYAEELDGPIRPALSFPGGGAGDLPGPSAV